jgi:hypothetical protein
MSGRSAYVRKEKTKVKDGGTSSEGNSERTGTSISDFPMPTHSPYDAEQMYPNSSEISTIMSVGSDDLAYARVRKPHVPVIEVSGIEKSSFRSVMDKKSESFRKGLSKTFGGKKKKNGDSDGRPQTSTTFRPESHELDSGDYIPPSFKARQQQLSEPDYVRPGPPQTKLPPIPQGPALKRWIGGGRPPQAWNKLRKDPELWDPNGDTLVFLGPETRPSARPPPSFRLSSHVLEATESRYLLSLLREGATDANSFGMPPSPLNSPGMRSVQPARQGYQHTPPTSDEGNSSYDMYDGQISYEISFPTPTNKSQTEAIRHNVTTRNVFAVLYQASLVGLNLYQALDDLRERLESYMPSTDPIGMLLEYVVGKGFDNVRENPSMAVAMLAWSESPGIRWEQGWRESFVHCAGMYNRLEATPEYKYLTPVTRSLLDGKSLEVSVRVGGCEERLKDFDFLDQWRPMQDNSPSRAAFQRCQKFLLQHYRNSYESWPPSAPHGHDLWLHRNLTQKLQSDFGALYEYFVNRDVIWDGSEERSGRKWNLVNYGDASFQADTADCPFTDILVAFDNLHKYPHIPCPYPLVPDTLPQRSDSKENLLKMKKSAAKPQEDKMAERKAALAYTESTNIYILGSDFVSNDLVDAFIKFEKGDRAGDTDPYAARRGRWVLIYFILQTLASISVDTPHIRYINDVSYHMSPKLRGTPPWLAMGTNQDIDEASHVRSHCWTIRSTWPQHHTPPLIMGTTRRNAHHSHSVRSAAPSVASSDAEGSVRSPTMSSATASTTGKSRRSHRKDINEHQLPPYTGFSSHNVDEWPIKEEDFSRNRPQKEFLIKDFDDYQF